MIQTHFITMVTYSRQLGYMENKQSKPAWLPRLPTVYNLVTMINKQSKLTVEQGSPHKLKLHQSPLEWHHLPTKVQEVLPVGSKVSREGRQTGW
jgi:hypothetical protein